MLKKITNKTSVKIYKKNPLTIYAHYTLKIFSSFFLGTYCFNGATWSLETQQNGMKTKDFNGSCDLSPSFF